MRNTNYTFKRYLFKKKGDPQYITILFSEYYSVLCLFYMGLVDEHDLMSLFEEDVLGVKLGANGINIGLYSGDSHADKALMLDDLEELYKEYRLDAHESSHVFFANAIDKFRSCHEDQLSLRDRASIYKMFSKASFLHDKHMEVISVVIDLDDKLQFTPTINQITGTFVSFGKNRLSTRLDSAASDFLCKMKKGNHYVLTWNPKRGLYDIRRRTNDYAKLGALDTPISSIINQLKAWDDPGYKVMMNNISLQRKAQPKRKKKTVQA